MTSNKTITRYLLHAKICVNQALITTTDGNELATMGYLRKAIHWLRSADTLIIQKHITNCVPRMIQDKRVTEAIEELVKTYKYIPS